MPAAGRNGDLSRVWTPVRRCSSLSAQDWPDVAILGIVVADEFMAELPSSLLERCRDRLRALDAGRDRLEMRRVAPQGLVDCPHEADICSRYVGRHSLA
jgi:hypothetical protein